MENFGLICEVIVAVAGVIPTVVSVILLVANTIKNKNWNAIVEMIKAGMSAAESYAAEHPGMSGQEKLDMALASVKAACAAQGITLDEKMIKKIIAYIEQLCKWSKTVNTTSCK